MRQTTADAAGLTATASNLPALLGALAVPAALQQALQGIVVPDIFLPGSFEHVFCISDCRILLTRRILKGPKSALFGPETAILDPQKSVEDFEPPHLDHLRPLRIGSPRAVSGGFEAQNLDFDADFG